MWEVVFGDQKLDDEKNSNKHNIVVRHTTIPLSNGITTYINYPKDICDEIGIQVRGALSDKSFRYYSHNFYTMYLAHHLSLIISASVFCCLQTLSSSFSCRRKLTVCFGIVSRGNITLNYIVKEFYGICYSVELQVDSAKEKTFLFLPANIFLAELSRVWRLLKIEKSSCKIGAWIVDSTEARILNKVKY